LLVGIQDNTLINLQELLNTYYTLDQEKKIASLEPKDVYVKLTSIIDEIVRSEQDIEIREDSGMELWRIDEFLDYFKD